MQRQGVESSKDIEARAAQWLMKRELETWSSADQAALSEWLEAATINRVAFLRLEAGWREANRLKALGAGFPRGAVPTAEELGNGLAPAMHRQETASSAGWRWPSVRWPALAATLLLGIGILLHASLPWVGERYTTPIGGVASVPLKDGSSVTLNTASRIHVRMTQTERRIELAQGEAFFDVAKDATRPFVVQAGRERIVAVGTQFSVRREGDDVQVTVTEGVVRLENDDSGTSRLAAGMVARAVDGDVTLQEKPLPDVEELLSWRSGYLVFHQTSLAAAVAEFNRYNERKIFIDGATVAGMRLTGKFRSTNYETFVRLLEETFQVRAEHTPDRIILTEAPR